MNKRTNQRSELGITQSEAARRAGISLATWRRWEDDPDSVSDKTRSACEALIDRETQHAAALAESAASFQAAWADDPNLTPRQAWAIATELDGWANLEIAEWLIHQNGPLHQIGPFDMFDLRVMMLVGENPAWVEAVRRRCNVVRDELESGVLPFDRPGPLIDGLLIWTALWGAEGMLTEMPDLFEQIPARPSVEYDEEALDSGEALPVGDEEWDLVRGAFEDRGLDDWDMVLNNGCPGLSALLAARHPFSWLDEV